MERRDGFKIAVPVRDALTKALIDNRIDILMIDPFIKAHRIPENDNPLMDAVVTTFNDIADDANCAVELVQHARKTSGNDITIEDARGASSIIGAARVGRITNRMTKSDGEKVGIAEDQCRYHVRIDTPRSSMAPPSKAPWIKLHNVGLDNFGPDGEEEDRVQVAIPWQWPDPFADLSTESLREVQRRTPEKPRRIDPRSPDWIGYLIIDVLRLDRDSKAAKHKAKEIFETWRKKFMFKIVDGKDGKGKDRDFVVVDQLA
jgi:hypothetical protein